ncbi:MAG: bi-domain-containing oxidoreductase [Pseudomonadota bacterium]|nr:bi-domain-containing oxidoreductase [Pseudomonadota bacterium]
MKQVLMTNERAIIARTPRPAVEPGSLLVQTHFSLISTGTELASLKAVLAQEDAGAMGRVAELSSRASYYLGKAVGNPAKAAQRLKQIAASRVKRLTEAARAPRAGAPKVAVLTDLGWTKASAPALEKRDSGFSFTADQSPAGYQAISRRIYVRELDAGDAGAAQGAAVAVSIKGTVKGGPFTLGMLNGDQSAWIGQVQLDAGDIDETLQFDAGASDSLYLVIANAGEGGGSADFAEFTAQLKAPQADGLPASETDQIGWNIGYSAAGEVVAVGEGVTGFQVGDMVACGGAGQANHAEFISVKRNLCVKIPNGVEARHAATTTVGAIAMQGVRRADLRLGETACVVGLGLIGLITVQILKASGCRVIGLDLDEDRARRARELGADAAAVSADEALRLSQHLTGGHGADATIITAAAKTDALINNAMKTTRRRGRVVIVGDIGMNIERPDFYKKEIDVLMSTSYGPGRYDWSYEVEGRDYPYAYVRWTQNRNMQAYLELVAAQKVNVDALIDEVAPVEDAAKVYDTLARSKKAPLGVVFAYAPQKDVALEPAAADRRDAARVNIRGARIARGDKIRYCLVGAGGFGVSMLVPQMDKRRDIFQLQAVCSRDPVRGGNFARQRGVEALITDYDAVLADPNIDMVVIATRHFEHAGQVAKALAAGKHVFVEKPIATDWAGLDRVREAYVNANDRLLMVGFNRSFSPAALAVRERLQNRKAPLMINYRLNGGYIPGESWIQNAEGAGRNIGEACHMYDFFAALAGAKPEAISAQAISPQGSAYFANDNFAATIRYADGSVGNLLYTASGPKTGLPKERIEIFCEGRAFVIDDFVKCVEQPSGETVWEAQAADKGHAREMALLADALASGAEEAPIAASRIFETTAVSLHIEDLLQGRARE